MFTRIRNLHPVTGVVVGVVATLVLSGTAVAITDTNFTYSTTKTGYLTIHPMDMAPDSSSSAADYYIGSVNASLTANAFGCFNTGPSHRSWDDRLVRVHR